MKWMVTGSNGMLAQDVLARLADREAEIVAFDRKEMDITDPVAVRKFVTDVDVVVNLAAYTAVDAAEENEPAAFTVNATGPEVLARRCREIGATLVHISTDYVFGGEATEPYGENDLMEPRSAYGRTKAAGEWAVRANADKYYILRTAWLYGAGGKCFPKTMASLSRTHDRLSVVTDEFGQPTWTDDVARLILEVVDKHVPYGTYHATSTGKTNWWEFTREIVRTLGKDPEMVGETTAAAFDRPAPRPHFSVLDHGALEAVGIEPIGDWRERWQVAAPSVLADFLEK
ncbi:dTDP-4-dehydrorhamnose reductase [Neoactinobaculum massilliense]|uniref:dTDP-4-dehydrorhamnose reductase n=1 Tax=Neoactinobaculum massilliense TaxID=2364794 RepID=UPI000F53553F|nr:dTDP-4-dehydrorhamnose reductase [Neoactinobaculum massilliense]